MCLYTGVRRGSAFYSCLFMCLNGLLIATMVFFALGFHFSGAGGVFSMIKSFKKNVAVGVFMVLDLIGWSCVGLLQLYVMVSVLRNNPGHPDPAGREGDYEQQALEYAYQNKAAVADAVSQLPSSTPMAQPAQVSSSVYGQPDEVGSAIASYNATLAPAYSNANPGDAYDPRSVFG